MTARQQNFMMNRGESKRIVADETINESDGTQFPFGAYQELIWTLYDFRAGPILVQKKDSETQDVTVTDASVGAYNIKINPADTDNVDIVGDKEDFFHRVRLIDENGDEHDLMEGVITIHE